MTKTSEKGYLLKKMLSNIPEADRRYVEKNMMKLSGKAIFIIYDYLYSPKKKI